MLQTKQVEFTKEIDDVLVLLIHIVKEVKDKKSALEIASGSLAKLMSAIEGVDKIGDEVRVYRNVALQTIGYRGGELADVLLGAAPSEINGVPTA